GELGLYGFRNRQDHDYDSMAVANAQAVKAPRVWDFLSQADRRSIVLGVPQTYPPSALKGLMVSGFLAPSKESAYTYPRWLKAKIGQWAGGEYWLDVEGFRTNGKGRLLRDIQRMTQARFRLASRMLEEDWDFFMMVEMGTDRIQHGFWRFMDPAHRLYEPGNPYEAVIPDYYRDLDSMIGALTDKLPPNTLVLVVSDHGAKSMQGGVAINEWLMRQGLLVLKDPGAQGPLSAEMVDWARTKVWGEGGYYARLFFNIKDREPRGALDPSGVDEFRSRLITELEQMPGPDGRPLGNQVFVPQDIYRQTKGIPPDLIVHLGGLSWRSLAGVGQEGIFAFDNDTGPDDANHSMEGILIASLKGGTLPCPPGGRILDRPLDILGVAPTILEALGMKAPAPMSAGPFDPWQDS
ncbi:MAG: alkaline phosphatase family protein, partial [Desulfarculaceae bacterium]